MQLTSIGAFGAYVCNVVVSGTIAFRVKARKADVRDAIVGKGCCRHHNRHVLAAAASATSPIGKSPDPTLGIDGIDGIDGIEPF